ncbi:hypothetical protein B7463_g6172, partial [Scytalidium lignicola]
MRKRAKTNEQDLSDSEWLEERAKPNPSTVPMDGNISQYRLRYRSESDHYRNDLKRSSSFEQLLEQRTMTNTEGPDSPLPGKTSQNDPCSDASGIGPSRATAVGQGGDVSQDKTKSSSGCENSSIGGKIGSSESLQHPSSDLKGKAKEVPADHSHAQSRRDSTDSGSSKCDEELSKAKIWSPEEVKGFKSSGALSGTRSFQPSGNDFEQRGAREILDNMEDYFDSPGPDEHSSTLPVKKDKIYIQISSSYKEVAGKNRIQNTQSLARPSNEGEYNRSHSNLPQEPGNATAHSESAPGVRKTSYSMGTLTKTFAKMRRPQTLRAQDNEKTRKSSLFRLLRSFSLGDTTTSGQVSSSSPADNSDPQNSGPSRTNPSVQQYLQTEDGIVVIGEDIYTNPPENRVDQNEISTIPPVQNDPIAPWPLREHNVSKSTASSTFSFPRTSLRIFLNGTTEQLNGRRKEGVSFDALRALIQSSSDRCWIFLVEDLACYACVEEVILQRNGVQAQPYPQRMSAQFKMKLKKTHHECTHENQARLFFSRIGEDDAKRLNSIALVSQAECAVNMDSLASAINTLKTHLPNIQHAEYIIHKSDSCERQGKQNAKLFMALLRDLQDLLPNNTCLVPRGVNIHKEYDDEWKRLRRRRLQTSRSKGSENKFLSMFGWK